MRIALTTILHLCPQSSVRVLPLSWRTRTAGGVSLPLLPRCLLRDRDAIFGDEFRE